MQTLREENMISIWGWGASQPLWLHQVEAET